MILTLVLASLGQSETTEFTAGPLLGHLTPESAIIWARMDREGQYTLEVESEKTSLLCAATTGPDLTLRWELTSTL